MSYWYEPEIKDMHLNDNEKEFHVLIGNDENGNIWVSLKTSDVKEVLKKKLKLIRDGPFEMGS